MGGAPSKATIRRTIIFHTVTGFELKRKGVCSLDDSNESNDEEEHAGDDGEQSLDQSRSKKQKLKKKGQRSDEVTEILKQTTIRRQSKSLTKTRNASKRHQSRTNDMDEWDHDSIHFDVTEFQQPPPFESIISLSIDSPLPRVAIVKKLIEVNNATIASSNINAKGWKKRLQAQKR
jgi:hypothetical protein